jgi:hypothetical protein
MGNTFDGSPASGDTGETMATRAADWRRAGALFPREARFARPQRPPETSIVVPVM